MFGGTSMKIFEKFYFISHMTVWVISEQIMPMLDFEILITGKICDRISNWHMYIPRCIDCQKNKSRMTKPAGPPHLLPIPGEWGYSVAIDFIGPLPINEEFDMVCSMTDHLGSDIQLVPTISMLTADGMALPFFNQWYCENGIPLTLICDKLFMLWFWKVLHKLIEVSVEMSSVLPSSN